VLAGPVLYPLEAAGAVLRRYRDVIADAPDELTTVLNLRLAPRLAAIPADVHGRPVLMIGCCWAGDPTEGEVALRPLRQLGPVLADLLEPRPYLQLQSMYDAAVPHGWHYYWKSVEVPPFTDGAIDTLVDHASALTSQRSYCIIFQMGGALSRVDAGATAFTQRSPGHNININAVWTEDDHDERHVAWTRAYYDAMRPHATEHVYLNFLDEDEPERVRAAFDPSTYERLVALKRQYDPDNVFRGTLNISP
jgi:FAD/FMN-containing dehydrogenase